MKTIKREQTDREKAVSKSKKWARRKGLDFEAYLLKTLLERDIKAYQGRQGKRGGKRNADVSVLDSHGDVWFHIECKRGKRPNAKKALEQAIRDCVIGTPVAVCCEDADKPGAFRTETVTMRLHDWLDLIGMVKP